MEFVPYEFCDRVVILANPKKLAEIEKLEGYWSEAVQNPANHHSDVELTVIPVDGDHWKCYLSDWNTHHIISNWEGLSAANHCLVLNAVTVMSGDFYKTLSTAELIKLLLNCYKKPIEWVYRAPSYRMMTDQQWTQITKLFENFNICRIQVRYEPGCRQFLVRALASQYLVGIHIRDDRAEIPTSMNSHIQEWARRVEFDEMFIESRNLQIEFSIFEKLIKRIEGGRVRSLPLGRYRLSVYVSEAECVKIRNFLGTSGLIATCGRHHNEYFGRWVKEKVSVRIRKSRSLHWAAVARFHVDTEDA